MNYKIIALCLILNVLDIVTGNLVHILIVKDWKSSIMRTGLVHKLFFVLAIVLCVIIDVGQSFIDLGFRIPLTSAVCVYICITEIGSNWENIKLGNDTLKDFNLKKGD